MTIKTKNLLLLIFQAVATLLLFCPGVYTCEFWKLTEDAHIGIEARYRDSFLSKLTDAEFGTGLLIGILTLAMMVALLVVCNIQLSKGKHFAVISILSVLQIGLLLGFSFLFPEQRWTGDLAWSYYSIAFLFYVIMALLIAISVIAFVSNYTIKKDGIKEEVTKVAQNSGADEIVKYKELLDKGIITQEEYDAKKKQLLGL